MRRLLLLLALLVATPVLAGDPVYRYTDADGVVHYTDRAPDRHARPIRLAPLSGAAGAPRDRPKLFYTPEALREAARFSVRVESPTPGERFVDRAPGVAAASVMPGLVRGFTLVYQLDGRALTPAPVDVLSVPLQTVSTGIHELVVVLLDARRQEVARSPASRFEVFRTSAKRGALETIASTEMVQ